MLHLAPRGLRHVISRPEPASYIQAPIFATTEAIQMTV
jgi:hypothetical protein